MQAVAHFSEAGQVMLGRLGSEWAVHAWLDKVATVDPHLLGRLFVHIGVARCDEVFRRAVHEVKIIAGLVGFVVAGLAPVKAQPFHAVDDGVDVFHLLFFRVGVVKTQVAHATVVACQAKVQANAFGMANVQVAIGLGRETGADFGSV